MTMLPRVREKYTNERVNTLSNYLKNYSEKGTPLDYEVLVDGFKAVRRTNDADRFFEYDDFITSKTDHVEISIFPNHSNNCEKYILYLRDENIPPSTRGGSLNGLGRGGDAVELAKREWEHKLLQEKNAELEAEVELLEEDNQRLTKELAERQSKDEQDLLKGVIGAGGAQFLTTLFKSNPKLQGTALAGLLGEPEKTTEAPMEDTAVSFAPAATQNGLSEADQESLKLVQRLNTFFSEEEYMKIMQILDKLSRDKQDIDTILGLLNNK